MPEPKRLLLFRGANVLVPRLDGQGATTQLPRGDYRRRAAPRAYGPKDATKGTVHGGVGASRLRRALARRDLAPRAARPRGSSTSPLKARLHDYRPRWLACPLQTTLSGTSR